MATIAGSSEVEMTTFVDRTVREADESNSVIDLSNTTSNTPQTATWGSRVVTFLKDPMTVAVTGGLAIVAGLVLIALAVASHGAAIPAIIAIGMKLGCGLGGSLVAVGSAAVYGSVFLVAKENEEVSDQNKEVKDDQLDDDKSKLPVLVKSQEEPELARVQMNVVNG